MIDGGHVNAGCRTPVKGIGRRWSRPGLPPGPERSGRIFLCSFVGVQSNNYWSATENDANNAWNVNLNNGNVNSNNPSNTNYASCVSGQHKVSGAILLK